jgi:hypothetical protein
MTVAVGLRRPDLLSLSEELPPIVQATRDFSDVLGSRASDHETVMGEVLARHHLRESATNVKTWLLDISALENDHCHIGASIEIGDTF